MANLTLVDSNVWDGVERRAGNNPNRIGIVLTRVRRPVLPQPCASAAPNPLEQVQKHERQPEAPR